MISYPSPGYHSQAQRIIHHNIEPTSLLTTTDSGVSTCSNGEGGRFLDTPVSVVSTESNVYPTQKYIKGNAHSHDYNYNYNYHPHHTFLSLQPHYFNTISPSGASINAIDSVFKLKLEPKRDELNVEKHINNDNYSNNSSNSNINNNNLNVILKEPVSIQKRSKSGCLTCRARKRKCDETKPICKECARINMKCVYECKIENKSKIKSQSKGNDNKNEGTLFFSTEQSSSKILKTSKKFHLRGKDNEIILMKKLALNETFLEGFGVIKVLRAKVDYKILDGKMVYRA